MITAKHNPQEGRLLPSETTPEKKDAPPPLVNRAGSDQNTGTDGRASGQYIRKYKITKMDAAPAAGSLSMSFDDIQGMLAGTPEFQHLELQEVERDGNCFFHALADVIKHNDVALGQFTNSYHQLEAKLLSGSAGESQPELGAAIVRRFIHGWLQWGGESVPEFWETLGSVIIPTSDSSLQDHHKCGFIRDMAQFSHATNYYGWDGLLAVFQLATGIPIQLLQVRSCGQSRTIVSEVFDISALEEATGDLFSKLREKDPTLVKFPNDALLSGHQSGLYLVHSNGDHYYSALPKPPAELVDRTCPAVNDSEDQQAGVEDEVPAEHNATGGAIKPAEGRVFAAARNIPEEPAVVDREPEVVAKELKLWVFGWSADNIPSVIGLAGANYSGQGARLVDPESDDELLDAILKEFPDITDWYPAIAPYRVKRNQPEDQGDSSGSGDASGSVTFKDGSSPEAGKFREEASENPDNSETPKGNIADPSFGMHVSAGGSKKVPVLDSSQMVWPLLAFSPMKSFEEAIGMDISVVSSRNGRHKTISRREACQQAFKECITSWQEMRMKNFGEYHDFFTKERNKVFESSLNKTERYYNQGLGGALYNQAIGLMDEALCIAISLINIVNNYNSRYFYNEKLSPDFFKRYVLPSYNDTLFNLLNFSNVFRYIILSDRSVKFDIRFLHLQTLLTGVLENSKDTDIGINSQVLSTYIYTMIVLFQQEHYFFSDKQGEQSICSRIVGLMYFVAKVIKGYSLGRSEDLTAECSSSILLGALERHRVKVINIEELIINLEVLLLLAGGNSLYSREGQIVFGIKRNKRNSNKGGEGNVKAKKRNSKKKQPLVKKDKTDKNPVKKPTENLEGINKDWVDGEKIIEHIVRVCNDLFTSPMGLDHDDSERVAYLNEVAELLSNNQDCFPRLKTFLEEFKGRCDALKRGLHEAAEKQKKDLRIEVERKRKSYAEQRRSKKHKNLSRSDTGRKKSPGGQASVKIGDTTNNTPCHGVSSANGPERQVVRLSATKAVLTKAEAKIQRAMELIRQSEQPESLPGKETKKTNAKKEYLQAIQILDDFLERNDSEQASSGKGDVDYDIALVLLTVSSWRIDYEYQFTGFFDQMYQAFDTASIWDNLFTIGMRQAVLPAYPKHKDLMALTEKFQNVVRQLTDGEHCNIARALNEQNRALAILQSHYQSAGGSEQLPYYDDQMDHLQKNQAFFDAIKTEYARARKNVLSAIASRRLIKRHLLPPNYFRRQSGKGTAPQYTPGQLIQMLKSADIDLQNKFINQVEVRRTRLAGLH